MRATSAGFFTLAIIGAAYAQESNADLVTKLRAAPANTDRIALLTDNQVSPFLMNIFSRAVLTASPVRLRLPQPKDGYHDWLRWPHCLCEL